MKKIVIAIDGHSACGKSSTARAVAGKLRYGYIDTGAMYRAVTLYFVNHYVSLDNDKEIEKALSNINIEFKNNPETHQNETFLNGSNVEQQIRQMHVSNKVSAVSSIKAVREAMVKQQRKMGKNKGIVMDGRDIGTVVFPDAELKVFMTAETETRATRRQKELLEKGEVVNLSEIMENLNNRDHQDTHRKESPLKKANDAIELDTTNLTFDEQVEVVVGLAISEICD